MTEAGSHYVHGTDPEEQRRLSRLNDLLNQGSLRELALQGGESILDLGCGLGQLTCLMARAAGPRGRVVGIDRSEEQLAQARLNAAAFEGADRVEFRSGDVLPLSLPDQEWGGYDVAHTRFLLEHVPDPLTVVKDMVRAVKPGGRIVLEDDDHDLIRPWPEVPGFRAAWAAYMESYVRAGNDPIVGRRLVELLHQAGALPRRATYVFFGACAGDPFFPDYVSNLIGVLAGARAAILGEGTVEEGGFDALLAALRAWGQRPDAALWYVMAWAEGVRK